MLAAAGEYREAVEGAGIEFAPVRPGFAGLGDYGSLVAKAFDVRRGPEFLIRELIMPHLRSAYDDLLVASRDCDFLVSHPLTYALPLVAAKRRLPWAATVLSPMSLVSCHDPPTIASAIWLDGFRRLGPRFYRPVFALAKLCLRHWEKPLERLRREIGLPPETRPAIFEGQFSPLLNIALFDRQLAPVQPDWPQRLQICGAPLYDGLPADPAVLSGLDDFLGQGERPLVFVLGSSAVWLAGDFWQKAIAASRELGRRAILITGQQDPGPLPEGILAIHSLPYSRIFPEAAAIIHQAGIGTLAQAMRAGCPQLIVPVAFDQPDNARRAANLGLARVLPFRQVRGERLVSELGRLLTEPQYRARAAEIAGQLAATHGADCAAGALIAAAEAGPSPG